MRRFVLGRDLSEGSFWPILSQQKVQGSKNITNGKVLYEAIRCTSSIGHSHHAQCEDDVQRDGEYTDAVPKVADDVHPGGLISVTQVGVVVVPVVVALITLVVVTVIIWIIHDMLVYHSSLHNIMYIIAIIHPNESQQQQYDVYEKDMIMRTPDAQHVLRHLKQNTLVARV